MHISTYVVSTTVLTVVCLEVSSPALHMLGLSEELLSGYLIQFVSIWILKWATLSGVKLPSQTILDPYICLQFWILTLFTILNTHLVYNFGSSHCLQFWILTLFTSFGSSHCLHFWILTFFTIYFESSHCLQFWILILFTFLDPHIVYKFGSSHCLQFWIALQTYLDAYSKNYQKTFKTFKHCYCITFSSFLPLYSSLSS